MTLPQPGEMSGDVAPAYVRHKPEQTLRYQLVEQYWPEFQAQLNDTGRFLARHVRREFEDYLACGRLENGFLRVRCHSCSHEHLVAFSCKRRGFCTSCGARRMVETAALLVDHVLPHRPVRQWVLSFPYPLRFLLASQPQAMGKVLAVVNRAISSYLINKAGLKVSEAHTGAVTLIQRFGSALLTVSSLAPHYQIELYKSGSMDAVRILVEVTSDSDHSAVSEAAAASLVKRVKDNVGISTEVEVGQAGSVARSEGKAKRVVDKR